MALNLDEQVTPNHWSVDQFEPFNKLSMDEEFNLIAPITIYFAADLKYRREARGAIKQLQKLEHPLVDGKNAASLLEDPPEGLYQRYNALMMAIVHDKAPEAEPLIDSYGAYSFKLGDSETVLAGDGAGLFAYYLRAEAVRDRVDQALGIEKPRQRWQP